MLQEKASAAFARLPSAHLIGMATPRLCSSSSSSLKTSSPSYSVSLFVGSSVLAGEQDSSWRKSPGLGDESTLPLVMLLAGECATTKPILVTAGLGLAGLAIAQNKCRCAVCACADVGGR